VADACRRPPARTFDIWLSCLYATLTDVLSPKFERLVCKYATKVISIQCDQSVNLMHECIMISDNVFTLPVFLADRTNGRAIGTVLRLSVVCRL